MPAVLGIAGYWGKVLATRLPAITPEETFKLFGALGLTTLGCLVPISLMREPIPPGIPLLRPSMACTPIIGCGIAASSTCFISGILLGARNSLINIGALASTLAAAAAGGAAGGG